MGLRACSNPSTYWAQYLVPPGPVPAPLPGERLPPLSFPKAAGVGLQPLGDPAGQTLCKGLPLGSIAPPPAAGDWGPVAQAGRGCGLGARPACGGPPRPQGQHPEGWGGRWARAFPATGRPCSLSLCLSPPGSASTVLFCFIHICKKPEAL